jgi:hypothetical protein
VVAPAWQSALAAEHRAVFGYGLLGPQLKGSDQALAVACSDAHEQLRDATVAALSAAHLVPVAPAADYPDLGTVASSAAARVLAVHLEDACAAAWRYLYFRAASGDGDAALRDTAQAALTASAVRATKWRSLVDPSAATTPFPGIPAR